MKLREILTIPKLDEERLEMIQLLVEQINEANDQQEDEKADTLVAKFNEETGKEFDVFDFIEYKSLATPAEIAKALVTPVVPRVDDISKTELVEIIGIIKQEGENMEFYLQLLEKSLFYHSVEEIIFEPAVLDMPSNMSVDEVADKLLSFQPGQMT